MDCLSLFMFCTAVVGVFKFLEWILRKWSFSPSELKEKYVFITGCDSGFGNALAKRLSRRGINVIAACLTSKGASELDQSTPSNVHVCNLDVTNHDNVVTCYEKVKKIIPADKGLWGIVNNAGVTGFTGPLDWCDINHYKRVIDVNLIGVIDVTLTFLPLIYKGKGRVVNVSSAYGRFPMISGGYSEAKFGVESFTDALRLHFRSIGVPCHSSVLEPGHFTTNVTDKTAWRSALQSSYKHLRAETKDFYPHDWQEYINKVADENDRGLDILLSTKIYKVVDSYEHALVSRWPKKRYATGWDARIIWVPLSYFPSCISDVIITFLLRSRKIR